MILAFAERTKKAISITLLTVLYLQTVLPAYAFGGRPARVVLPPAAAPLHIPPPPTPAVAAEKKMAPAAAKAAFGGPTQPEFTSFHSVSSDNMVDLFTGDFKYNIPLLDVDGYPIAIGYNGGVTMDQEASWVGLGWNLNPGTIARNMRGLPDDFNGNDSITKTINIKENKTIGVDAKASFSFWDIPITASANVGVFHNTYRGWGMESGLNVSIRAGAKSAGSLTAGLGLSNNTQEGLSVSPNISLSLSEKDAQNKGGFGGNISAGLSYNTRGGLKALQFSGGLRMMANFKQVASEQLTMMRWKNLRNGGGYEREINKLSKLTGAAPQGVDGTFSSSISFAYPSSLPNMEIPYTSSSISGSFDFGGAVFGAYGAVGLSGYVTKQAIAPEDRTRRFPAYGYLNFYNGAQNPVGLLDYNREREIPIKESVRNIAIPSYTADIFSISGEGTGGVFRAYRNDIGYVNDHRMTTKSKSASIGVNLGVGNLFHVGADVNFSDAYSENRAWTDYNNLAANTRFTQSSKDYEAVYFRNPGEMGAIDKNYFDRLGGDDIVVPELSGHRSRTIGTTGNLLKYRGGAVIDKLPVTQATSVKSSRAKRSQLITYLTADEASKAGFSKFIENYSVNKYFLGTCDNSIPDDLETPQGFKAEFFWYEFMDDYHHLSYRDLKNLNFDDIWQFRGNNGINDVINWHEPESEHNENAWFSFRAKGRLKAPVTGVYNIHVSADDGCRFWINGNRLIDLYWGVNEGTHETTASVNLEAGKYYDVWFDYFNGETHAGFQFDMSCNGVKVTWDNFSVPETVDTMAVNPSLSLEKRVNAFRKPNHISEIDVLNSDGQRYVYGLPVYTIKQDEATFSVDRYKGNAAEGTVAYVPKVDDDVTNTRGNDRYFSGERIPAYAHSYLLTAVLSPDYVDLTGDGVSDDDPGNAVRFNYSKVAGIANPYTWRIPYGDKATYNEGLKSDTTDDKGSYVYGEKELWYLNSIVSKNMVATFKLEDRSDLAPINKAGIIQQNSGLPKLLREINLYTKADFLKYGANAIPIKTVHFDYTYDLCKNPATGTGKLTLKGIWFSYNGNVSKNPDRARRNGYVFYYNKNNPSFDTKSFDRWGNYKDMTKNPNYTTDNPVTNVEYPYTLQDSAAMASNVAAWMLDSIKLPSGGRMKINYESDDYAFVQNRRACVLTPIAGLSQGRPSSLGNLSNHLYDRVGNGVYDNLYVSFNVSKAVTSRAEIFNNYLAGLHDTLFFRLNVNMPDNRVGKGNEYIHCYGYLDGNDYGFYNNGKTIYVKLKSVQVDGDEGGGYSPLANSAIQFLKTALPSKAYSDSDVGETLDGAAALKLLASLATTVQDEIRGFPRTARLKGMARDLDLSRSAARLNEPYYKKYGGGHRVKSILIYDNWNAMTGQKESLYGTVYSYTTDKEIDGKLTTISSGVAAYEPVIGGEDNPWHTPLTYKDKLGKLVSSVASYVETPLGESFFPAPSVGYSRVRVSSIHTKNVKSQTGYSESTFYTAYDFPTIVTASEIVGDQMKAQYKPAFGNMFKINARNYLGMSQGFKIELNDMHGKPRGEYAYKTGDSLPISSKEFYYKVDNEKSEFQHLNNTVLAIDKQGNIDSAVMGLDMELMMDQRQQRSVTNGIVANGAVEGFYVITVVSSFAGFGYPQSEDVMFRSAAATKVINRRGILDRVVVSDKGSVVTTKNLLFDAENGNALLTSVQNEFDDPLYSFAYPANWVYDGMGPAYQNINNTLDHIDVRGGKLLTNIAPLSPATFFSSGDELLVYTHPGVAGTDCNEALATFPSAARVWVVDANSLNGGPPDLYFMQRDGSPFTGLDMSIKILRSGRRNIAAQVGSVTMMKNPIEQNGSKYKLVIDDSKQVIDASMQEYRQNWKVQDKNLMKIECSLK